MTEIEKIRADLKAAPEAMQPFIRTLGIQLRNYERGNEGEREALRPVIEQSLRLIERAGCGR